jgi:hypothetical protein
LALKNLIGISFQELKHYPASHMDKALTKIQPECHNGARDLLDIVRALIVHLTMQLHSIIRSLPIMGAQKAMKFEASLHRFKGMESIALQSPTIGL